MQGWIEFFCGVLEEHRASRGLTQEALAEMLGVGKGYISQLEHGRKNPSLAWLIRFAHILGADVGELVKEIARREMDPS